MGLRSRSSQRTCGPGGHDKKPTPTYQQGCVVGMNRHSNRHTSEEVQDAFKVLMTHGFCNSHDVSHFAAFFIVVGAKTSVAESVDYVILFAKSVPHTRRSRCLLFNGSLSGYFVCFQ